MFIFYVDDTFGALLDLVLVHDPSLVQTIATLSPLGSSDHALLKVHLTLRITGLRPQSLWSYDKTNFSAINNRLLSLDWSKVLHLDLNSS